MHVAVAWRHPIERTTTGHLPNIRDVIATERPRLEIAALRAAVEEWQRCVTTISRRIDAVEILPNVCARIRLIRRKLEVVHERIRLSLKPGCGREREDADSNTLLQSRREN